ncbi:Structural maintenance of chromosomes protein 5 [Mortierella sp. NVP85]|nr:Structural maintenance of chromosomes protein 5 [Mortierella sp. NVP85]
MAKIEGHNKRPRGEEVELTWDQEPSVPRNRISSSLHGVQDKSEAKDVSEFVKHGADKGWVEIVLYNKSGTNVVIKRHINKNNNTSVWKINGENKTQKDVIKKVQSLNIQIDNLCQFLPQDRVAEFAQMTPQELLKETQRAVGGEDMLQDHQKLIDLWNEHKTITASVKGDLESIETNEKRNAVIEKDVVRFQQREAVLRRVRFLEIWIMYAKYGVAKEEYNNVKEARRVCLAMYKQLQADVVPLEKRLGDLERKEKQCSEEKAALDQQHQKSVQAMKAKGSSIEAAEGEGEELKKDLDRLQIKNQQRQAAISNIRRNIAAQQELIDKAPSDEQLNKEKDELQNKVVAMQREIESVKETIDTLQSSQMEIIHESKRINSRMAESRRRLEELDDIKVRRLEFLKTHDNDVVEAVIWLRENRHLFQRHIFEPVCLELNIKNMNYVNAIENSLRNHIKTFVCQTRDDYDIFTREVLDKKKLRVNIIAPRPQELDLENYAPPVPSAQLREFGFSCYMLDAIDGPPELLAAMCSKAGLHAIPIADSPTVDFQAIRDSKRFKRYATSTTSYIVSYSRHTGEAMDTAAQLRPAQVFTASVDQEERARLIREVDGMRSELEQNESRIRDLTANENAQRKTHQGYLDKRDSLKRARQDVLATLSDKQRKLVSLERYKSELERKLNEPSSEEEEEKIRQALRKMASRRCKLTWEYLQLAKESQKFFSNLTLATLNRLQAQAELQAQEALCTEKAKLLKEMENNYTAANDQYDRIKVHAKELLDRAKEEYNTLQPEDITDFQALGKGIPLEELEDMFAGETAKAALHYTPNQSVIDKYEQRQGEIKVAREKVEAKERKMAKLAADIENIRAPWFAKVTELVSKISDGFSKSFEKIGCAGEVKLGEHEDYDKWCIEILVKFRDAEKLQKLTGQRQSGGERSVSTIMYLMALQALSSASFRVVDEINQGMDPRNERLVHTQLVEKACAQGTAQYFLITPKLLPNLDYHERMKVLCIYNGEWLDESVMKWNPYIENQLRSKARRL